MKNTSKYISIEMFSQSDIQRFWKKVNIGNCAQCWNWNAGKCKDGYGKFAIGKHRKQIHMRAHRVSIAIFKKTQVDFADSVLHSCDNPSCVNPFHLRLGNHAENIQEKTARGRQAKGSTHGQAKISKAQVLEARKKLSEGATLSSVIKELNLPIKEAQLSSIRKNKNWKHV